VLRPYPEKRPPVWEVSCVSSSRVGQASSLPSFFSPKLEASATLLRSYVRCSSHCHTPPWGKVAHSWTSSEGATVFWPGVLSRLSPLQADEGGRTPGRGGAQPSLLVLMSPEGATERERILPPRWGLKKRKERVRRLAFRGLDSRSANLRRPARRLAVPSGLRKEVTPVGKCCAPCAPCSSTVM